MKKITSFIALTALVACYVPTHASVASEDFDFGTDPGKTTYQDAGFTAASDSDFTISDQADFVR